MKKQLSFMLAAVLTLAVALPGFAADYRQAAIDFLAEKHGVPKDHVHVSEGDKIILEYLQESFWCAKYEISADGPSPQVAPSQPSAAIEPAPPQVMPLPEPVLPVEQTAPDSPADPDAPVSSSNTPRYDTGDLPAPAKTGAVYVREKTGEVLDDAGMETYFLRERELAAAACEELRREAGKIDVNFYKRLKEAVAGDKYSVRIHPAFTETPELVQRFKDLQAAYPEYTKDISSLSELFAPYGSAATLEIVPDIAVPPSPPEAASDAPLLQGDGAGAGSPSFSDGSVEEPARDLPMINEDYEAYHRELEAIRLAGLEPSAKIIMDKLNDLGVTCTYDYDVIAAELTKAQINDIAGLEAVRLISDDLFYALEDGRALAGGSVTDDTAAELDGALPPATPISQKNTLSPYYLLLAILLLCAGYLLFRRRHSVN
ncbi:MAG: hypothetical protein GX200_09160 [Firmicutes bacterium]|nr:hypothetical protein [Bacillota bacterium]